MTIVDSLLKKSADKKLIRQYFAFYFSQTGILLPIEKHCNFLVAVSIIPRTAEKKMSINFKNLFDM